MPGFQFQLSQINQNQKQASEAAIAAAQRSAGMSPAQFNNTNFSVYGTPGVQQIAGNSPYPGHSNFAYPGETGQQTSQRLLKEWEIRGMQPLPVEWDAQRAGGAGKYGLDPQSNPLSNPAVSGGLYRLPDGSYAQSGQGGGSQQQQQQEDMLLQARQRAFALLAQQRGLYGQPGAQELESSMLGQMRGQNVPFTPDVVNAQLAGLSDTVAAGSAAEADQLRRSAANRGIGGGIVEYGLTAGRGEARKALTTGRREITSQRDLANFQAQERARSEYSNLVRDKAYNQWLANQAEVGLLSRFEQTGDAGYNSLANAVQQQQIGGQGALTGGAGGITSALGQSRPQAGGSSYGGVTFLDGANMQPWRQTSTPSRGTSMGLDLSGYTSKPAGETTRQYSDYSSYVNRPPAASGIPLSVPPNLWPAAQPKPAAASAWADTSWLTRSPTQGLYGQNSPYKSVLPGVPGGAQATQIYGPNSPAGGMTW